MLPMAVPLTTTRMRSRSRRLVPTRTGLDPARPSAAGAAARGLDERHEEIARGLIAPDQLLRMPLDADDEAVVVRRAPRPRRSPSGAHATVAQAVAQRLMAWWWMLFTSTSPRAENPRQPRAFAHDLHRVRGLDRAAPSGCASSAFGPTRSECPVRACRRARRSAPGGRGRSASSGPRRLHRTQRQPELERVPGGGDVVDRGVRRLAEARRLDVAAAGEKRGRPVVTAERAARLPALKLRRQQHGNAARLPGPLGGTRALT